MNLHPYYSTRWPRAVLQVVTDLLVVTWCWVWVRVAMFTHDAVTQVGEVGYRLQGGATGLRRGLDGAAGDAGNLPLIGDTLSKPLRAAGGAAADVASAGQDFGDRLTGLALPLAVVLAAAPIVAVVLVWLPARYRFARRAGETAALARVPGGESLLALRALATLPVHQLTAVAPDVVAAWRRDDPDVVTRLAVLEQRRRGVRPAAVPALPPAPAG